MSTFYTVKEKLQAKGLNKVFHSINQEINSQNQVDSRTAIFPREVVANRRIFNEAHADQFNAETIKYIVQQHKYQDKITNCLIASLHPPSPT